MQRLAGAALYAGMKKQIALLAIILLISAAYVISAAKRFGLWGVLLGCRVLVG
jgi:hypothetical protein